MDISLVLVNAKGETQEIVIPALPARIGRGEDCRIKLISSSISRSHCELLEEDDELVIRDLQSSNGTYVNGQRVRQRELAPGDLVSIGSFVLVVRIDGHPRDLDAAAAYASGAITPPTTGESRDVRTQTINPPPGKGRLVEDLGGDPDDSKFELDLDLDDEK